MKTPCLVIAAAVLAGCGGSGAQSLATDPRTAGAGSQPGLSGNYAGAADDARMQTVAGVPTYVHTAGTATATVSGSTLTIDSIEFAHEVCTMTIVPKGSPSNVGQLSGSCITAGVTTPASGTYQVGGQDGGTVFLVLHNQPGGGSLRVIGYPR